MKKSAIDHPREKKLLFNQVNACAAGINEKGVRGKDSTEKAKLAAVSTADTTAMRAYPT